MLVKVRGEQQIQLAVEVLKQGGLVAFPTDTLYALGAAANIDSAIEKLYAAKERSRHSPLPLLIADIAQLPEIAASIPEVAWRLAEHFLPGALTLVLPRSPAVSSLITAGGDTIAVRIPNHPVSLALLRWLGAPATGTSANLSGKSSPVTALEVAHQLGKRVDLILDGGRCPGGVESTIIDVTGEVPVILRRGAISQEEIEKIAGRCIRSDAYSHRQ